MGRAGTLLLGNEPLHAPAQGLFTEPQHSATMHFCGTTWCATPRLTPFHVYIDSGLRDSARTTTQTLKTVSTEVNGVLSQVLHLAYLYLWPYLEHASDWEVRRGLGRTVGEQPSALVPFHPYC